MDTHTHTRKVYSCSKNKERERESDTKENKRVINSEGNVLFVGGIVLEVIKMSRDIKDIYMVLSKGIVP